MSALRQGMDGTGGRESIRQGFRDNVNTIAQDVTTVQEKLQELQAISQQETQTQTTEKQQEIQNLLEKIQQSYTGIAQHIEQKKQDLNQASDPETSEISSELATMDDELTKIKEKVEDMQAVFTSIQGDLARLAEGLSEDTGSTGGVNTREARNNARRNRPRPPREEVAAATPEVSTPEASATRSASSETQHAEEASEVAEKGWWGRQVEALGSGDEWKERPAANVGRILGGVGIIWGVRKARNYLFKRKKDKEEPTPTASEITKKKPWYRRWYTWAIAGVAGLLGWRYGKDILALLFGKEKGKKDAFGKKIADALGDDWEYNVTTNRFKYKARYYDWEDFANKGLIHTTFNNQGETILDLEKTVVAIKEYVDNDTSTQPDSSSLIDPTKSNDKYEKLTESQREQWKRIGGQVNKFYQDFYKNDEDVLGKGELELDIGSMLFHLQVHYQNIGTLLNENTVPNMRDATHLTRLQRVLSFFPPQIIDARLATAGFLNRTGMDQLAQDIGRTADRFGKLTDSQKRALGDACLTLWRQRTAIAYYTLAVRDTYVQRVDFDDEKIKEFERSQLSILDQDTQQDEDIRYAIENPHIDSSLEQRVAARDKAQNDLLEQLEKANTRQERQEVIKALRRDINSVGYRTWTGALAMVWSHIRETQGYLEYDLLDQEYKKHIGDMEKDLKSLLEKPDLTDQDMEKVKQHIQDFYRSMQEMSKQVHLRQETNDDGRVTSSVWAIPLRSAGKVQRQAFKVYMEDGNYVLAAGTLMVADLASLPLRKGVGLFAPKRGRKVITLSPTWRTMKTIGTSRPAQATIGYVTRRPIRMASQTVNHARFIRSTTFRSPEHLYSALDKGHITLSDAAKMVTGKASGKTYLGARSQRIGGTAWRKEGFSTTHTQDALQQNMRKLLAKNERVNNTIINGRSLDNADVMRELDELAKHWDTRKIIQARYYGYDRQQTSSILRKLKDKTSNTPNTPNNRATTAVIDKVHTATTEINRKSQTILREIDAEIARIESLIDNSGGNSTNVLIRNLKKQKTDLVAVRELINNTPDEMLRTYRHLVDNMDAATLRLLMEHIDDDMIRMLENTEWQKLGQHLQNNHKLTKTQAADIVTGLRKEYTRFVDSLKTQIRQMLRGAQASAEIRRVLRVF